MPDARAPLCAFLIAAGAVAPSSAQAHGDARDVVTLKSGEELRGRVLQRYDPKVLVLDQSGKRRELEWSKVERVQTVAEAVAELLSVRTEGLTVAADWSLAQTAAARQLHAMARLQAMHVLLREPDHAEAHALLGHKGGPGKWRWLIDGDAVPAAALGKRTLGKKFTLASEHFVLHSQSGLRAAIDALIDLERTYAVFWKELGTELRPLSKFDPIEVHMHPSKQDQPKLSTLVVEPYCDPSRAGGGVIHTWLEPSETHPARLPAVAVEQLIYRTLLDPRAGLPQTIRNRYCAWIEVGLGRWVDARESGNAGYLQFGPVKLDRMLADRVLRYRPYGLENFIGIDYLAFHDDGSASPFHLAHAAMLVAYCMDEQTSAGTPPTALRPRFLAYVRQCFHDGRGHGSSGLDGVFGSIGRIEALEAPWIEWLTKQTGLAALRAHHELRARWSVRNRLVPMGIR